MPATKQKTKKPNQAIQADHYLAKPGKPVRLKHFATDEKDRSIDKDQGEKLLKENTAALADLQERLYAASQYRILVVFQAMDAAGKDSTLKHVMRGLNPNGVRVTNFKVPNSNELAHDYFWRHYIALPGRGEIGIFNRSHYENVLVTKVHPEYVLNERLPGIQSVADIKPSFWTQRYKQIRRFEKNLAENGTIILKFFLHVSKEEQKKRFLARIDNPEKHWKFSAADIRERGYWDDYQLAYQDAIEATSTDEAPWYIIPADDKWYMQLAVSSIIRMTMEKLDLQYPVLPREEEDALQDARKQLEKE